MCVVKLFKTPAITCNKLINEKTKFLCRPCNVILSRFFTSALRHFSFNDSKPYLHRGSKTDRLFLTNAEVHTHDCFYNNNRVYQFCKQINLPCYRFLIKLPGVESRLIKRFSKVMNITSIGVFIVLV